MLFLLIAKGLKCETEITKILNETRFKTVNEHIAEFCTNIHFELKKFHRDKKKLARIDQNDLELLLEQVFVCGQFGFVEFVDTHFIVAALSWQHPKIGCFTNSRPEGIPNMGISGDIGIQNVGVSKQEDTCLPHFTAVAASALVTALRFILNPSPWPEYHSAADQLVAIDRIVAEDQFHTFRYIQWVQDAHFPTNMRPPKPPSIAIAPDLIAFVALLFIILIVIVIAHNACTSNSSRPFGKQKQLYPFAYKKL
uniref:Peptidase S8/S53 domain-containing protein n=1 Tax=Panagrolaimus sp. PS1159 TaxID=55785 RepID=A0AC35GA48_9BILA